MAINIYITDQNEIRIKFLGYLDIDDILEINKVAEKQHLRCLMSVDFIKYTIFNRDQIKELKTELNSLIDHKEIAVAISKVAYAVSQMPITYDKYLMFDGE